MSGRSIKEIRFRRSVPEQRRAELREEVNDYWKSMGINPHWLLELTLNSWVADGNSPYTNPYGDTDWKTGRVMDFWESILTRDHATTQKHIGELQLFRKKEDLEEILELTRKAIKDIK